MDRWTWQKIWCPQKNGFNVRFNGFWLLNSGKRTGNLIVETKHIFRWRINNLRIVFLLLHLGCCESRCWVLHWPIITDKRYLSEEDDGKKICKLSRNICLFKSDLDIFFPHSETRDVRFRVVLRSLCLFVSSASEWWGEKPRSPDTIPWQKWPSRSCYDKGHDEPWWE